VAPQADQVGILLAADGNHCADPAWRGCLTLKRFALFAESSGRRRFANSANKDCLIAVGQSGD
jgi:hypothetical protein